MKRTLKDWFIATRPWSFPASVMPVLATLSYLYWGNHEMNWLYGACALAGMVLFQAGGNLWSDYYDYKKGVDDIDTFGSKILTDKLFTPSEVRVFGFVLLLIPMLLGIWLVFCTGITLLWIGLCGVICAFYYPFFKFRAWGDVLIFVAYAVLPAIGTSYVVTGAICWDTLLAVTPIGMITVAILHINNMRDVKTDARAHISTVAMKMGVRPSVMLYVAELLVPFGWIVACIACGNYPLWTLLGCLVLPVSMKNVRVVWKLPQAGYHTISYLDQSTAQLQMLFSLVLALSFVISRVAG